MSDKPLQIALASTRDALERDDDLPPLHAALTAAGISAAVQCWGDAAVDWSGYDAVLLRSTWDYTWRLEDFLAWAQRVAACTRLLNPLPWVRWNTDKRYLQVLADAGIATVPTLFVAPGDAAAAALAQAQARWSGRELVIKPSISAGSRDTMRHGAAAHAAMHTHLAAILQTQRHALIQPYLTRTDHAGESALLFFAGQFSHAIRKGPLLAADRPPTRALFAPEHIQPRTPAADERALAERIVALLPTLLPQAQEPLYARVDLLRDDDGAPCLIELELIEPSLFLDGAPDAASRLVAALRQQLTAD